MRAAFTVALASALLAGCGGGSSSTTQKFTRLPFAVNAYFVASPDMSVTGQLYASDPDNLPITFSITTQPSNGTVTLGQNSGIVTYTPNHGFTGTDTFDFIATDSNGQSDTAVATVLVNPNPPTVSAFGAPVYVHASAPSSVAIAVRLSNPPNGQATVNYTTTDGTAKAGVDYTATSGTLTFGPGATSQTVTIQLSDAAAQTSRYFLLQLSNPSSNLTLGQATAAVVLRYYPEPLNDTGVTGCATDSNGNPSNPTTCPQASYPEQDADIGRDAANYAGTLVKVGSGVFGFDFTKLGNDGQPLFNQNANFNIDPWACVRDNWTGLEWEVPTPIAGQGLFDTSYVYTWYDPDPTTNGGGEGVSEGGPYKMDTYHFVQAANQYGLCGHSDWRLPTAAELRNLINIGAPGTPSGPLPSIPTFQSAGYWTATPAPQPGRAVVISAQYGYDSFLPKSGLTGGAGGYYTILVRGGGS